IVGRETSNYSAIEPIWQWDNRDHVFFPTKGNWVEASVLASSDILGATQNFIKWTLDARTYRSKRTDHVWVAQLYLEGNSGTPPFNQLALLGGTRLLRGYYEGRFRDRQMAVAQLEYRFPIYRRFGGVGFASLGSITPQWSDWEANFLRYTFGAGIRFMLLPEDKIRLRFDYGVGKNTSAFYFTVGEAF
ncbi:MAG: BamA/TamA family outer membrane protein, partial [Bacteroidota bacterium]